MHPLIEARRSPRAFDPTPLDPADVDGLLEAARWAASSMNAQPWRFVLAPIGGPAHERLAGLLASGNRRWAPSAPLLVLVGAKATFDDGSPNRHAWHDTGAAVAQLTLEATSRGLAVHAMGGLDRARAHEVFGLPAEVEVVSALAIGRPGDPASLPDDLRAREQAPRSRRPLAELVLPAP